MIRLGTTEAVQTKRPAIGPSVSNAGISRRGTAGREWRPTMNDFSTLQSWDTLTLSTLKKIGSEHHGPCPVTGKGKDCFWVKRDDRLIGCRGCSHDGSGKLDRSQFKEHLEALGAEFGASDVLLTYDWLDHDSGETVIQTRHAGEPKYLWPPRTKTGALVYLKRYNPDATRPIVWTEGAKAATAAASKLPADDYDVIGFVSSTVIPSADTLKARTKGRSCIVWPDDDLPGAKVGHEAPVRPCARSGADVATVDPARLELTGGHGHDAAEWHPRELTGRRVNSVRHA